MDVIRKWKSVPRNQRILRWKLFKDLQFLLNNEFDEFVNRVGNNEELMEHLFSVTRDYESIKEKDTDHLKYGLENTPLWQDISNGNINDLNKIKEEYENSVFEKAIN